MNSLQKPLYDDASSIDALAHNAQLASYPQLLLALPNLIAGYQQYEHVGGDAWQVTPVLLTEAVREYLRRHYKSPPAALEFINTLRRDAAHKTCPMCGSFHRGTLDHVLPQGGYAEFAVYSRNLVPACLCNSKRSTTTRGAHAGERVLHPYFDECLGLRLIAARFDDLGRVPRVTIRSRVRPGNLFAPAVAFHIEAIIDRTTIKDYLADRWTKMCRRPVSIVREFRRVPANIKALRSLLVREIRELDSEHEAKNNWRSVFVAGLLDKHVAQWVLAHLNRPGRPPQGPLIDA